MTTVRSKPGSAFGLGATLTATALAAATFAVAAWSFDAYPNRYYRSVQEDQTLEWATFIAFMAAAVLFLRSGLQRWRDDGELPWFRWGVALFSFFVAMEEISWAQRVFAYRPPSYFLEYNFQQELNLHNIVDSDYRKLALKGILLGYGVALPLIGWLWQRYSGRSDAAEQPRGPLRWLAAIEPPPLGLAPLFFFSFLAYHLYPWDFTGEWVEMVMGLGFLFAALTSVWHLRPTRRPVLTLALWTALTFAAGGALAFSSDTLRRSDPGLLTAAQAELDALAADLERLDDACQNRGHLNKRVFSYELKYEEPSLYEGAFAGLTAQGLPEDRALYFLDPWNYPYWVQCTLDDDREFGYVYSFGPNRQRESTQWVIRGDDLGSVFHEWAE